MILNFALSEMASKNPGPSLILDCDIAQIISSHTWFLDDRLSPIFDKVWRDPEYELVLLPCCHNVHFYLLAAVLDERDPVIFVLESIGGSYAKPPPVTEQFKSVLEETRQMIDGKRLAYRTFIPEVPRQNPGSNDCGIFTLKYVKKIVSNPKEFIQAAKSDCLRWWFQFNVTKSHKVSRISLKEEMKA